MNPLLAQIAAPPSATMVKEYRGSVPLLDLTAGTPWFGPPRVFNDTIAALVADSGETARRHDTYAPHRGAAALRAAIAARYRNSVPGMDPETRILVTHGATGAVWTAVLAVTSVGDEVLLPDPCYTLYEPIVTILGREPVLVAGDPAAGMMLDPADVARAISPRTRLLLLNSPVNPTGAMYERERLSGIAAVTRRCGVTLVHDEVLDCYARRRPHVPAAELSDSGVLMVNSLSKRLGITGWRVGWLAGDSTLIDAAARAHPLTSIAVNHAAQLAGAAALQAADHETFIADRARRIAETGRDFLAAIADILDLGYRPELPDGGVYAFLDIAELAKSLRIDSARPDLAVAQRFRDRCGVAVLPGGVFGPAGENFIRISLGAPADRLAEAGTRLRALR